MPRQKNAVIMRGVNGMVNRWQVKGPQCVGDTGKGVRFTPVETQGLPALDGRDILCFLTPEDLADLLGAISVVPIIDAGIEAEYFKVLDFLRGQS